MPKADVNAGIRKLDAREKASGCKLAIVDQDGENVSEKEWRAVGVWLTGIMLAQMEHKMSTAPMVLKSRHNKEWTTWSMMDQKSADWVASRLDKAEPFEGRKLVAVPFEEARKKRSSSILSGMVGTHSAGYSRSQYQTMVENQVRVF